MGKLIISLAEACKRLGEDVVICLEPEEFMASKLAKNKELELWVLDPITGISARGDKRFFDVRFLDRGGWGQLCIHQEPGIEAVEGTRVVGHVVVQTMVHEGKRLIRVRPNDGLSRKILELRPSSYSKNDLCGKLGCQPHGISEADPQRLTGDILHFVLEEDFPPEEGMTITEFVAKTTDGRALNALAKVGLLVAAE
jgi:hypothetical protein